MNIHSKQKGFTLIELVIYIGILALFVFIVADSMISITRSYATLKSARAIHFSALSSYDRLANQIRDGREINLGLSTLGSHPGTLAVVSDTGSGDSTIVFSLENGRLKVVTDSVEEGFLTKDDTTITNLVFNKFLVNGSEGVRVEMTIESVHGTSTRSSVFYNTFKLRGSY